MIVLRKPHIIRNFALIAVLCMVSALAGCGLVTDSDLNCSDGDKDDISVSFRLFTGKSSSTRAVDEYGTADESYIDLENLKILLFDETGVLKQVLYDNGVLSENTSLTELSYGFYLVQTKLDREKFSLDSKFAIVALANWRSNDDDSKLICDWKGRRMDVSEVGSLTMDHLKEMTLTLNPDVDGDEQPESWMPGEGRWIPMFGSRFATIAGYDDSVFGESNPMPIPDVVLVRAISKIEIENNDIEGGPTIDNIILSHRNTGGWLMQDFTYTGATDNVTATTKRGDTGHTTKPLPFHQDGNRYTVYIPELNYYDNNDRKAICVNVDMNGIKHQKWIYLAPYGMNGNPMLMDSYNSDWDAIKRNYIYRYTINSLGFEFLIDVVQWQFGGKVHINLEQPDVE